MRTRATPAKLPRAPSPRSGSGAVVGTLADSGGALPHYTILAETPGDPSTGTHATATADSLGGFVLDGLAPGRYRLFVRAFAHKADSSDVEVVAGQIDTVVLRPIFFQCVR